VCVQCVSTGATAIPAALAALGGMVWKHRRDEARDVAAESAQSGVMVEERGQLSGSDSDQ